VGSGFISNTYRLSYHTRTSPGQKRLLPARRIIIATGARSKLPAIPGVELATTYEGMWRLEQQPKRVAFIGGGHIAGRQGVEAPTSYYPARTSSLGNRATNVDSAR
jgi:pyruvate/2-oxoglutarate dehydrogenase complex dihydrolipoamide dehydrogenase (E3) component